ncbi:hypothetical protein GLW08_08185 [Pontibacillus yanchengensis]|uniref:Uncharacterized protein n=1 Tax=Pontibacillus yanchengensis TaxID=462910 RepID=A0ACC7VEI4_9BACI|nr:hypothetical protein [Pontibacillus yanchengensis]MYL53316.1 hypothetical protein [Pontibacillus yanchengensis]
MLNIRTNAKGDYIFEGDEEVMSKISGANLSKVDLSDYNISFDVLYRLYDRAKSVQGGKSVSYEQILTEDGPEKGEATYTNYADLYAAMKQRLIERNQLIKQKGLR